LIPRKAIHREGRQGREGKQSNGLLIKITNLAIESRFTLALISLALISLASLASLAVQMLNLGLLLPIRRNRILRRIA
jgi:hypothetical protein